MSQQTRNIRSSQANFQIFNQTQTDPGPIQSSTYPPNWGRLVSKQIPNGYNFFKRILILPQIFLLSLILFA